MDMYEAKGLVAHLYGVMHLKDGTNQLMGVVKWLTLQNQNGPIDLDEFYALPGYRLASSMPAASWSAAWHQVFEAIRGPESIGRGLIADLNRIAAVHGAGSRADQANRLRNRIKFFSDTIKHMNQGMGLVKGEASGPGAVPSLTFAFRHDMETVRLDATLERMQLVRDLTSVLAEIVGEPVRHEVLYLGRGSFWLAVAASIGAVKLVASTIKSLADAVKGVVDAVKAVRAVRDSPAGKNETVMHTLEVTITREREQMLETVTAKVRSDYPDADPEVVLAMVSATSDLLMRGDRVFPHAPEQPEGPVDLEDEVIFVFDESMDEFGEVSTEGPEHHMDRVSTSSKK